MAYDALTKYRFDRIRAAKDFEYGSKAIERIKRAKSMKEISEIMRACRRAQC